MNTAEKQQKQEIKINVKSILLFLIKFAAIIALVFAVLYGLNYAMSELIEQERVTEAERRAIEMEWLRLQENYDAIYASNYAFYDISCHYDGQFLEIFEKHVNADYIFLGTSHITHGVTPEAFEKSGKRFFNFALNGSNPSYYVWWYNDVFKANHYVKPKAVIFGVNWFMFDTNWLWRKPEFDFEYLNRVSVMPPSDNDSEFEPAAAPPVMRYTGRWYDADALVTYVTNRFPVFSSRERFIELVMPEPEKNQNEDITEPELMFEIKDKDKEAEQRVREIRYGPGRQCRLDLFYKGYAPWEADFQGHHAGTARTTVFDEEIEAFNDLLDRFRAEGIPVIFVMAPEFLPGRDAPQFDDLTHEIALIAARRSIPFLNYNAELVSEINHTYEYYSDWGHLNHTGAHRFSARLYDDLNEILNFNDFDE